ncbi:MAG: CbbQ/NirQ/NorQ/GpvN family protein [SAR202 cluster bacterium]|nr:CbbQ/NirQ/NorQ/GpvN family protein [SAR202 cluster bacterium]
MRDAEEYFIEKEPFYLPVTDEVNLFESAYKHKIPVLLKGPTGCGKTRFVEYMSYKLGISVKQQKKVNNSVPLITIACHEDLTASDLVGRFILKGDETHWVDGPLTKAVKIGAICYLDEIVEARNDTTVLIHPLTDHRRILPIDRLGTLVEASDNFLLVISYNPGYQSVAKDIKNSTRQRFVAIEFSPPPLEIETNIIAHEAGIDLTMAEDLAQLGSKIRNLNQYGLDEGASTRLLIYAGKLISADISPRRACEIAINLPITDDPTLSSSIAEVISSIFP